MGSTASRLLDHRHVHRADEALRTRLRRQLATVPEILPQFSHYTLVSALALVLDFAIYLLLAAGEMKVALAGALGYACGLALHYVLSVRYVFDAHAAHKGQSRLFAEFAVSGLAGMAITALVIAAAVEAGAMPLLPAKALAVGVSFLVVSVLRRSVVFAGRRS
jgi:putative flippase GtrA